MASDFRTITPQRLAESAQNNGGVDLIDVRTPAEFREVHSIYAKNVPLDSLDPKAVVAARNGNADQPLYVICRGDGMAELKEKGIISEAALEHQKAKLLG